MDSYYKQRDGDSKFRNHHQSHAHARSIPPETRTSVHCGAPSATGALPSPLASGNLWTAAARRGGSRCWRSGRATGSGTSRRGRWCATSSWGCPTASPCPSPSPRGSPAPARPPRSSLLPASQRSPPAPSPWDLEGNCMIKLLCLSLLPLPFSSRLTTDLSGSYQRLPCPFTQTGYQILSFIN